MTRRAPKALAIAAVAFAMAASALAAPSKDASTDKHKPPYERGPRGGDDFNHMEVDRRSGTMSIYRLFPFPGSFGCIPESRAAWATFRVVHKVDVPAAAVALRFKDVWLDSNTWITLQAREADGTWLGYKAVQGPMPGAYGTINMRLRGAGARSGEITIQFGLQMSSACPQVEAARASFPSVEIKEG